MHDRGFFYEYVTNFTFHNILYSKIHPTVLQMPKRKTEDKAPHGSKPLHRVPRRRKQKHTQGTQTELTSTSIQFSQNSFHQINCAYNNLLFSVEAARRINNASARPRNVTRTFNAAVNGTHEEQPYTILLPRDIVSPDTFLCSPDDNVLISYSAPSTNTRQTADATFLFRDWEGLT